MLVKIQYCQLLTNYSQIQQGYDPEYLRAFSREELYEECFDKLSQIPDDEISCIPCNTEEKSMVFDTEKLVPYPCKIEDKFRSSFNAVTESHKEYYFFDLKTLTWKHRDVTHDKFCI